MTEDLNLPKWQTSYEYDALGRPTFVKPAQDAWTRFSYTRATSPASLAESYAARLNNGGGAVETANGVVVTQANDPNGIARPASITAAKSGTTLWTTGAYQYDGTGNIWKMGPSWYEYDSLSRVKTGTVFPDPLGTGSQQKQSYAFDNYGNLQSIATQIGANPASTRNTPASASTNRLTGAVSYDAAGNLTSWNGALYEYDAFDQMWHMASGSEDWVYSYTADDLHWSLGVEFSGHRQPAPERPFRLCRSGSRTPACVLPKSLRTNGCGGQLSSLLY